MHLSETLAAAADPTIVTILLSAIGALASSVAFLWKQTSEHFKEIKDKLADCEDDREDLWKALIAHNPAAETVRKSK